MNKNSLTLNNFSLPTPSDFFSYTRAVSQIPLLSEKEEKKYIKQWAENKDSEAAKWLVLSNLHLVVKIVKNHRGYGLNDGDLAQEGTVGLMKAVHKFSPEKGVRLATYAWYWIEAQVKEFILKNWRMISWGTSTLAKKLFFGYRKTLANLQNVGDERQVPSTDEIASAMGVSSEHAQMAHRYFMGQDVEIVEDYEEGDGGDVNKKSLVTTVQTNITPYEMAIESERKQKLLALEHSLQDLDDRHGEIIKSRYFSDPPETLSTLSGKMGISIERVRQIEKEAIGMLKDKFSNNNPN